MPEIANKNSKEKYLYLILIALFALICSYFIFKGRAATADSVNIEAELMSITTGAKSAADSTASRGSMVVLADPARQRFPGDPNPKVTGKIYWGSSITGNGDPYARQEQYVGKSLSIRRTFQGNWGARNNAATIAKEDIKKDRLPFVSLKVAPSDWKTFADSITPGSAKEKEVDDILTKLDSVGGPVWLAVHHEPENDATATNTAAHWRSVQIKFSERMKALGTKNIAFAPALMACTWPGGACDSRDEEDWYVNGIWDAYFVDYYKHKLVPGDGQAWKNFRAWISAKGLPYGAAEWANWDETDPQKQGPEMRAFWEQGFQQPQQDMLAYSFFDSTLNDSAQMTATELVAFRDILKNDTRVQRLSTLGGSVKHTFNIKTAGNYKLWARVKGNSPTDYATVAIDGAAPTFIGGTALDAANWKWIDYKDAATSSKTQYSLSAGAHTISITSPNRGYKLDKIILVNDSCVPTGDGSNCYVMSTPDTTSPTVAISNPVNNSQIQNQVNITASASDNIAVTKVDLFIDDVLKKTFTAQPYSLAWDTKTAVNGVHVIRVRAYDASNNYKDSSINVTVNNSVTSLVGDLNADGKVNTTDLSIVIGKWGTDDVVADISKNGVVDLADLSVIISKWTG